MICTRPHVLSEEASRSRRAFVLCASLKKHLSAAVEPFVSLPLCVMFLYLEPSEGGSVLEDKSRFLRAVLKFHSGDFPSFHFWRVLINTKIFKLCGVCVTVLPDTHNKSTTNDGFRPTNTFIETRMKCFLGGGGEGKPPQHESEQY